MYLGWQSKVLRVLLCLAEIKHVIANRMKSKDLFLLLHKVTDIVTMTVTVTETLWQDLALQYL